MRVQEVWLPEIVFGPDFILSNQPINSLLNDTWTARTCRGNISANMINSPINR